MLDKLETITCEDDFQFYRKNSKHRVVKHTPRSVYHATIVNLFWNKVADKMIEKTGGVFIRDFGYFFICIDPKRGAKQHEFLKKKFFNPATKSYRFFPMFIPNRSIWELRYFTTDRLYTDRFRSKLVKKLKAGKMYKCYYNEIITTLNKYNDKVG
ncbi:MAG: hypothetical protein CMH22_05480 [Methylophaga sp.]|nr:hypothetical protein [Methylophaga sp.]